MSKRNKGGNPSNSQHDVLSQPDLEKSWKEVAQLLAEEDVQHDKVQKLAEKIFHSSVASGSPDGDALEVLSVSLLHQSKWAALVQLLSAHAQLVQVNAQLSFHLSYALYREKQINRALDELRKRALTAGPQGLEDGELHLQAQANYRAGNYAAAAKVYRETHLKEDEDVELQANMLAALVSAGLLDEAQQYCQRLHVLSDPPSYELAYNAACGLIESGEFDTALRTLHKAQALCRTVLEEDGVTEEEIEAELAGLRVQEAFVLQQLAKLPTADGSELDRALSLYQSVLSLKNLSDRNVHSIASNNLVTLQPQSTRIFDVLKKSHRAMEQDMKEMTLSMRQKQVIQINRALVLFHGKQYEKCRELLQALSKEFPNNVQVALTLAAVIAREKGSKSKEAEEILNQWIKTNDSASAEAIQQVYLAQAHLALLKGDASAAASALTQLSQSKAGAQYELQYRPGMVSTLVALYERANEIETAHSVIQKAIQHWSAKKKDTRAARNLQLILSSAGEFYKRHNREADAAALLELLAAETQSGSSESSRTESVARLVLAYTSDADKQAQYASMLPPLQVPSSLDVKELESVPAPEVAKRRKAGKSKSASATVDGEEDGSDGEEEGGKSEAALSASMAKAAARKAAKEARKAKAKTKPPRRLPKGFDPANPGPPPDPERWLPKWERSNFKKFKRKGNAIRGAQGSTNMASMQTEAASSSSEAVESKGKMSGAAAVAARKRAGKKK